jgi:LysR family transcriptional repressor of citA
MNIESLKTFITLSEVQNFTKTAQQHSIVQSSVSNRIKELENEIGKKLFIRNNKKIELTMYGEILLKYAHKIVSLEKDFFTNIDNLSTYSDRLNIGTVTAIYDCHLYKFINEFIQTNNNISLNIINTKSLNLINLLHDGCIDIAFSYLPFFDANYQCKPFKCDDFLLVTSPQNNTYKDGITDNEIRNLPIIYTDFFSIGLNDWFYNLFAKNYKFKLELDIASKSISTLKSGIGYSFLPSSYIKDELNDGSLVSINLLETVPLELQSYILSKNKSKIDNATYEFMQFLLDKKNL